MNEMIFLLVEALGERERERERVHNCNKLDIGI